MSSNETFIDKNGIERKRQRCSIRTRVMGYLRPIMGANIGKRSEFFSRTNFKDTSCNSVYLRKRENAKFIKQFTSKIETNGQEKTN